MLPEYQQLQNNVDLYLGVPRSVPCMLVKLSFECRYDTTMRTSFHNWPCEANLFACCQTWIAGIRVQSALRNATSIAIWTVLSDCKLS